MSYATVSLCHRIVISTFSHCDLIVFTLRLDSFCDKGRGCLFHTMMFLDIFQRNIMVIVMVHVSVYQMLMQKYDIMTFLLAKKLFRTTHMLFAYSFKEFYGIHILCYAVSNLLGIAHGKHYGGRAVHYVATSKHALACGHAVRYLTC